MREIPLNDLSRITADEVDALTKVFREVCSSGHYLKGAYTRQLEERLSMMLGGRPVVAVGNGTDALTLAIAALALRSGQKVAVVPNAGGYGTVAARRLGLRTEMVDVNPRTAQMDPLCLRDVLRSSHEIGAVIVTHLYGLCGDVEGIVATCQEHGVPLIEDCAQSVGAMKDGVPAGSFGELSTFSFYPTKNLGALGDGGAVSAADATLASRVSKLAQYGWEERYRVEISQGFNSRLDEIQAAILLERLDRLESDNLRRREIVMRYAESVREPRFVIHELSRAFVGHLAVLVSPDRQGDAEALLGAGIQTGVHYPVLDPVQPAWQDGGCLPTPVAETLVSRIVTLPCFPAMTEDEIVRVCTVLGSL
jgi:dTDP-4-amino-4,6-dideoxygalactose transaminase